MQMLPIIVVSALIGMEAHQLVVPEFEVVSIKPSSNQRSPTVTAPDRFYRSGATLRELVAFAFELPEHFVLDGPAWIASDRWEISAKAAGASTALQMRSMLRRVLVDRFGLRSHSETRVLPVDELLVARQDRRLGAYIKSAAFDCEPFRSGIRPMSESTEHLPGFGCDIVGVAVGGAFIARVYGVSMSRLATLLHGRFEVDRPVVDRTALEGSFDVELRFAHGATFSVEAADRLNIPDRPAPLPVALEEQLGLKLIPSKGPVNVIVIDSAERPKPD